MDDVKKGLLIGAGVVVVLGAIALKKSGTSMNEVTAKVVKGAKKTYKAAKEAVNDAVEQVKLSAEVLNKNFEAAKTGKHTGGKPHGKK